MPKIKIITDSTADIPKELAKEFDITVVPLKVQFGNEVYADWYDLSSNEFFKKLKDYPEAPTTSQVTPSAFEDVFRKELEHHENLICITLSSVASGTYQSAMIAREIVSESSIEVIDSMTFSYGYGMIVVEAAKMAKEGKSRQEIVDVVNSMLQRLETYFIVDTLEYLKKGGRISSATAAIGTILNIKPVLTVKDGLVVPIDKIRGSKNVIPKMIELIKNKGYDLSNMIVSVAHGAVPERIDELKKVLKEEFNLNGIAVAEVGSVIGTHAGPGVFGIFLIKDK